MFVTFFKKKKAIIYKLTFCKKQWNGQDKLLHNTPGEETSIKYKTWCFKKEWKFSNNWKWTFSDLKFVKMFLCIRMLCEEFNISLFWNNVLVFEDIIFYMNVFRYIWRFLQVFKGIQKYLIISKVLENFWRYFETFEDVWKYLKIFQKPLKIFGNIWRYFKIFEDFGKYFKIFYKISRFLKNF